MTHFLVSRGGPVTVATGHVLEAGGNLKTGEADLFADFGTLTSLEGDLLVLTAAVFAADRATVRGAREDHCRTIRLTIPVVNAIRLMPLLPDIERVLRRLSNDGWTIRLEQMAGTPETSFELPSPSGKTLLFSGGIDSLAAAIEFGKEATVLQLVSHCTRNSTTTVAQRELARRLRTAGFNIAHHQYFVSSTDGGPTDLAHAVENSQRTRSFVFLILGALAARRTGSFELMYLAENGQMAIHLPLTSARIGSFSTHTAHPAVLQSMERILRGALQAPITIQNPYVYRTKREVTSVVTSELPDAMSDTTSCWRNAHLPAGTTHCGDCIPCQIRRIAVEAIGRDPTMYARDLWAEPVVTLPPEDDGRRNLADLSDFIARFSSGTNEELMSEYPELYSQAYDGQEAIAMYRRFATEARSVLMRYPNVLPFIS